MYFIKSLTDHCEVYGNRNIAPGMEKEEFSSALKKAIEFEDMKLMAEKFGKICKASGGRTEAAEAIAKLALGA